MSYGPVTGATTTGFPVASRALTRLTWVASLHTLLVVTTVMSLACAAATAWSFTAWLGEPVHSRCAVRPVAARLLVSVWVVLTPQPVTSTRVVADGVIGRMCWSLRSSVTERRA